MTARHTHPSPKQVDPPVREFSRKRMHRFIPAQYSETGTVLEDVTFDEKMLADAARLDAATNERIQGELSGLSGISSFELVYGIPHAHIVRAAFLHPGPFGARFNDATRGAWYAADATQTSIAEVSYHRARRLAAIVVPELPEQRPDRETSYYDDWQAGFDAPFHILEPAADFVDCLQPEPIPQCYGPSQHLARRLLAGQSNGIVYPSVRRDGATCLACFRPALVYQLRRADRYELRLTAVPVTADSPSGYKTAARKVPA